MMVQGDIAGLKVEPLAHWIEVETRAQQTGVTRRE